MSRTKYKKDRCFMAEDPERRAKQKSNIVPPKPQREIQEEVRAQGEADAARATDASELWTERPSQLEQGLSEVLGLFDCLECIVAKRTDGGFTTIYERQNSELQEPSQMRHPERE